MSIGVDVLTHPDDSYLALREVSLVQRGAVPGAEITRRFAFEPMPLAKSPAAVRTTSDDRTAAGDEVDDYRPPVWDELERIVGYRITDENQHQAFVEASRSPLDRIYAEHMAASKLEPGVIVRPGIGRVLGVR